jgi:hypothetical protein
VALLVGRLGDHGGDAPVTQMGADRAGRVGLVAANGVGSGARAADELLDTQLGQQRQHHRGISRLPGGDRDHQRQPASIDELVDLRAQTAPGSAYSMIKRLGSGPILVVR